MNHLEVLRIAHRIQQVLDEDRLSALPDVGPLPGSTVSPQTQDCPMTQEQLINLREQLRLQARELAIHCPDINDPADFAEFVALWVLAVVPIEQHDRAYFERLERRIRHDVARRAGDTVQKSSLRKQDR